ncbi:MAG: hypothetical protein CMP10_19305 [Zetaproteobacteria bacterium]|nr:hypothetical protein [Pseudobdellovibrionaceae bacterium]
MHLNFIIGLVVFLNATQGVAVAQAKGNKYAVVDMQKVILNVEDGKVARAKLEKEMKAKEKELLTKKSELDKMNKEWQSEAAILSEEARRKKQQDFQQKFMELRNQEMTFQQEIRRKEQMATQKIAMSVGQLVNKMSAKRGYEMVFEANSAGLLYLKDPVDLTKEVIAAYEKDSKKGVAKK